ncbi:MgtC/SapB family protein [bacterium]|nr:MgtC/SapB family protein [bacterium]
MTTAAGVWVSAGIGIAVGIGYYLLVITGVIITLVTLLGLEQQKRKPQGEDTSED